MQSKQQELTKSQTDVRGREERYQTAEGETHWPRQAASVRRGPQVIHDTSVTYIWHLLRSRNFSRCFSLKWLNAWHKEWIQNTEEKLGTSSQGWLSRMSAAETGLQSYRKEWHPGAMASHNTYWSHAILSGIFWQFWGTHCCSGFSGPCARFCKLRKTLPCHPPFGGSWMGTWALMSMASLCWYFYHLGQCVSCLALLGLLAACALVIPAPSELNISVSGCAGIWLRNFFSSCSSRR